MFLKNPHTFQQVLNSIMKEEFQIYFQKEHITGIGIIYKRTTLSGTWEYDAKCCYLHKSSLINTG
jgi:hypothetical protein